MRLLITATVFVLLNNWIDFNWMGYILFGLASVINFMLDFSYFSKFADEKKDNN